MSFAALYRSVADARRRHDNGGCRYGGTAIEVHFNPADIERLGIEEGEDISGLRAVTDDKVRAGKMRVYCDAELHGQGPPQVTTAVSTTRELVPA